jgi:uncharacterized protein YdiU (UPF0061 family)
MEKRHNEADVAPLEQRFVSTLPGELSGETIARQTPRVFYSLVRPTAVPKPEILLWSDEAAALLDWPNPLDKTGWQAEVLAGNRDLPGMKPYAMRYGGHQFGHWAGQLGDGRAITLGEVRNKNGDLWELQLKGAGPTPYSRRADGRAVLRSSLREFLCSEAMFHLGIPTTRALSLVATGQPVLRDMFYDGHPEWEPGAITSRLAPSFVRFGSFEILAASGELDNLKILADYVIREHYPQFAAGTEEGYRDWFHEICRRTARLMVEWLRVGFVHGVMNTDNMSILGLTIDYGPYGWLDVYDPGFTPNTTDASQKRYRFSQQPSVALWNLARLAEALAPLMQNPELLEAGFEVYRETFGNDYRSMTCRKLGIANWKGDSDEDLIRDLDQALSSTEIDMTLFYRALSEEAFSQSQEISPQMREAFYSPGPDAEGPLLAWIMRYRKRIASEGRAPAEVKAGMDLANPYFILRNYLVQEAIDALGRGDSTVMKELLQALKTPYERRPLTDKFSGRRPEWARQKAGCSDLSCSS